MDKVSYHTHSSISDGRLSPRELMEFATEKGFRVLAVTDHYFRPSFVSLNGWGSDFYTDEDYVWLRGLQEEYKDKINVLVGVEFEWYSNNKNWVEIEAKRRNYDIRIISIHHIFAEKKYYPVNYLDNDVGFIFSAFGGDAKKVVSCYYSNLREAVGSGLFDVIGHFDLINFFNEDSKYFSEDEDWYKKEVILALRAVKAAGIKIDLNLQRLILSTGKQYPSKWIIDKANEMDIELVVGTDSHRKESFDYDVKVVEKLLG